MFQSLIVRNFQSLEDVSLDLAPLTVIVGRSSSGKSALIRALTALIRNRRGTEFITHGERTASISATTSNGIVTLTRSTQTAPNSYTLIPALSKTEKQEFTKLGGETPEPVSTFLGIPASQAPLVIASQFDAPYLLSASPTEAARIFGSLTNASVLLDAARESNRRKLASAALLRTRTQDLAQIQQRIPEFQALRTQSQALSRAEQLLTQASALAQRLSALTEALDTLTIATQRIPALTARLQALPDPTALSASLDSLAASHARTTDRLNRFHVALNTLNRLSLALTQARTTALSSETAVTSASHDLAQALSGFEKNLSDYYLARSQTLDGGGKIDYLEAASLATAYVTSLEA